VSTAKVYAVTLNWNRADLTAACVDALLALQGDGVAIVICDNASEAGDVERLRHHARRWPGFLEHDATSPLHAAVPQPRCHVRLLHTGANRGYAGGINVGLRHALACGDAEFVWVLNNDCEVAPDALEPLLARAARAPAADLIGSTLLLHHEPARVQAWAGAGYTRWRARSAALGAFRPHGETPGDAAEVETQLAYVVGAAMFASRRWLDTVGLMDESYFLYAEEHDWAERGRRAGLALGWAPASIVRHHHGATIGTSASGGSTLSLFYLYRSKLWFAARHHAAWLPTALPMLAWDGLKLLLKGQLAKALAVWRGMAATVWPLKP
jgi:GT2 family glycosyltransferase